MPGHGSDDLAEAGIRDRPINPRIDDFRRVELRKEGRVVGFCG
jgi:hypothetical protein